MRIRHAFGFGLALCFVSTVQAHQTLDEELTDLVITEEIEVDATEVKQAESIDEFAKLDNMAKQQTKDFKFYYSKYPYEMGCLGLFVLMIFWLMIGK